MSDTLPLPAIVEFAGREVVLLKIGAPFNGGIWHRYPTADAVIDLDQEILFIAADIDPAPADWAAICGLIGAVGFSNGTHGHQGDPGEPRFDALAGVCTWRLERVPSCVWCDGRGISWGCPLCQRTLR